MVKRLKRVSPKIPSDQAAQSADLPDVVEKVPDWLKMLLAKYGETEGRLVGLEVQPMPAEEMIGPTRPASEEESQLSDLLEQMAEEGLEPTSDVDLPTSVEWGAGDTAPAEPSSPGIDDLLTSLGTVQPDYPTQPEPHEDIAYPALEVDEAAIEEQASADWLSDASGLPEQDYGQTPDYTTPTPGEGEVPGWLTEALEEPTAAKTSPPPPTVMPAPPVVSDEEVPDWLTDALTAPPPSAPSKQDQPPLPPTSADQEVPDWLAGMDVSSPAGSEVPPAADSEADSFTADIPDWQVPDWIATGFDEPSGEAQIQETPEPEVSPGDQTAVPDWIVSGQPSATAAEIPPTTAEMSEIPDWLETPASGEEVGPSVEGETQATFAAEVPEWLANIQEPTELPVAPPAQFPDWLENIQADVETRMPLPTGGEEDKTPVEHDATVVEERAGAVPSKPASKLKRLKPLKRLSPKPASPAPPDWVAGLVAATAATGQIDSTLPPWAADLVPSETASTTDVGAGPPPDWVTELVPPGHELGDETIAAPQPEAKHTPEAELETPSKVPAPTEIAAEPAAPAAETELDWLSGLRDSVSAETPPSLEPVEATSEVEFEMPAWLSETEEVPAESAAAAKLEIPEWLAGVEQTPAEAPAVPPEQTVEPELEIPEWLTETEQIPAEPTGEAEIGPTTEPSVVPAESAPEAEFEMPAWLSADEEAPSEQVPTIMDQATAEPEIEIPEWLAGPEEASTEAGTPAWLAEFPEIEPAEAFPAATEPATEPEIEMPTWLSDAGQAPTEETPVALAESAAEAEIEMPTWLDEVVETRAEAEPEIPEWLSEADDVSSKEIPAAFAEPTFEPEPETPSWLTELPGIEPEEPGPPPSEPVAEAEVGIPDWLSEMEQATTAEPPVAPVEPPVEPEFEMPTWLSGSEEVSSEQVPADATPEADAELPSWLAELPEVETEQPSAAPAGPELEIPAWLSEVEQTSVEELPPAPVESTTGAEPEIPSWLSELPEAAAQAPGLAPAEPGTETETEPDWLTAGDEISSAEETLAPTEPAGESETPSWLAGLSVEPTAAPAEEAEMPAPYPPADEPVSEIESELPAWLAELPEAESDQSPAVEAETEMPDWLSGIMGASAGQPSTEPPVETESELSWLIDEEPPLPPWLSEEPESEVDETSATSSNLADSVDPETTSAEESPVTSDSGEQTDESEQELPPWPWESAEIPPADQDGELPDLPENMERTGQETPPDQDWLTGLREATEAVKTVLPPEDAETFDTPPPPTTDAPEETGSDDPDQGSITASLASTPSAATRLSPGGQVSGWMEALKPAPTAELVADTEGGQAVETTGILAGSTGLLPIEKMITAAPAMQPQPTNGHADTVLKAAQDFYAVATQPPQPAALPVPLTRQRRRLTGNMVRAGLFLLFIILVALPLLPSLQRETPWTEPAGDLNTILGDRRRQLISEQLGVIDLQQPGSVALVSFDYSTATQGEMQPLAEAIIGRLKGQGMRIIFTSLEPEGAALAQTVLDKKRAEGYGVNMVNLGYIPGQVAAIRTLATGQTPLSTIRDFKEGLTFADAERVNWREVNNLGQVDLVVTLGDNPATVRWWIEQLQLAPPPDGSERFLLAATSAAAAPFLQPYRDNNQLDGLISGINGAAAIEASRKQSGPARQMLDSQSIAHLLIIILMAAGTIAGWMPRFPGNEAKNQPEETD